MELFFFFWVKNNTKALVYEPISWTRVERNERRTAKIPRTAKNGRSAFVGNTVQLRVRRKKRFGIIVKTSAAARSNIAAGHKHTTYGRTFGQKCLENTFLWISREIVRLASSQIDAICEVIPFFYWLAERTSKDHAHCSLHSSISRVHSLRWYSPKKVMANVGMDW